MIRTQQPPTDLTRSAPLIAAGLTLASANANAFTWGEDNWGSSLWGLGGTVQGIPAIPAVVVIALALCSGLLGLRQLRKRSDKDRR
jgi:hypothetical protein